MANAAYVALREAVVLLQVKPATLYTYVSRGWVDRIAAPGGRRGSLYSRADLLRLKARSDARAGHTAVAAAALRWGEPVIDSAITCVADGRLYYRGRDAIELALGGARFEQVAELLFGRGWPSPTASWPELDDPPAASVVRALLRDGPGPVRSASSALALLRARSPRFAGEGEAPELDRARALIRWLASGPGWAKPRRLRRDEGVALRCARALGVEGDEVVPALELALIVTADHELNASTFTARVVASAGSDLYACVSAAFAALSGPQHGGVSLRVEALLDEALAQRRPGDVVRERLARGARLPGFGHPLYPAGDPRARALIECAERIGPRSQRLAAMRALQDAARDAGLPPPNLDFGLVALSQALSLRAGAALFLLSIGRLAGWIAHIREQRDQGDRLRPRARYTGPTPERRAKTER